VAYIFVLRTGSATQAVDMELLREEVRETLEGLATSGYSDVDLAMGAYAVAVKLATRMGLRALELAAAAARGVLRRLNAY